MAAREGGTGTLEDHLARRQAFERRLSRRGRHRRRQVRHHAIPEDAADHRRAADDHPVGRLQGVQPGLQEAAQRRRDAQLSHRSGRHPPGIGAGVDHALLDEPFDQFLDVEGVAVGGLDDHLDEPCGHPVRPMEDVGDQRTGVGLREGAEVEPAVHRAAALRPGGPLLEQGGARGRQHEQRAAPGRLRQRLEAVQAGGVRPVQVLEQDDDRRPFGQPVQQAQHQPAPPPSQRLRIGARRPRPGRPRRGRSPARSPPSRRRRRCSPPLRAAPPSPRSTGGAPARGRRWCGCRRRSAKTLRSSPLAMSWVAGEARPRSTQTSVGSRASHVSTSWTSRDLPTPASPSTVTIRRAPCSTTSANACCSRSSSASRPTVRVTTPSTPRVSGQNSSWSAASTT